ncbi:hypothetical protein BIV57_09555 [Mangrovactinospora gilvigrisea]|uniref:Metal-dependent hydrolase n=1 Tax=Mangrovactinospora gilvigrisea TaxID=1428644 RepID=A0A1J7BGL9_9ACTN|nr:metal-dependent hydrolase [Mangrovactinospora gilvigrisea]OIV37798.1 hypothetical protein BIV57_09555 [Mangrovactinospora gilvigrisea]
MMGPAHSLSGAVAWLAVGAVAAERGTPMPPLVLAVGAVICAGAALAPDLDHKAATISRSFGPISRLACWFTHDLAEIVYKATRTRRDSHREGGHRTLTHTWFWAAATGAAAYGLSFLGKWAVLAIFFVHLVLAIEGLLWRWARRGHDVITWLLSAAVSWIVYEQLSNHPGQADWLFPHPYAWLGLPIALGVLVHILGDALTESGAPLFWPIPIDGKRWYPFGTPKVLRFRAGDKVEHLLVTPLLVVVGVLCGFGSFLLPIHSLSQLSFH